MNTKTLGGKLFISGIIILLLITMMIIATQIVVGLFKDTSNELVVEYNELNAVQELRFSFSQLLVPLTSYSIYGNHTDHQYFDILLHKVEEDLDLCENILTSSHDRGLLRDSRVIILEVKRIGYQIFKLDYIEEHEEIVSLLGEMGHEIDNGINNIDMLLLETKEEIDEFIITSKTIAKHSTITILTIGLLSALIIIFGGWLFIRSLVKPINELVSTTNKISLGEKDAKVNINSKDEFQVVAESFNKMLDTLNETTISKNYFNNILENMFDGLIVTNEHLEIQSVNEAIISLLGYEQSFLLSKDFRLFLNQYEDKKVSPDTHNLENHASRINNLEYLISVNGLDIPVLLSSSILKDQSGKSVGLIIVVHDLTEKKAFERKIELNRKQKMIDINEAQEEERMRIATDLHDGLGQMLTAISYAVQNLKRKGAARNIKSVNEPVKLIQDQIDRAIRETKTLAQNLIPIVLKDFGLIVAIQNLIGRANELYSTNFHFDAFDFNERIDPKREKAIYRICQESLNNIIKHAKASNATYQLFWQDCSVVIVIEDDGVGFDASLIEKNEEKTGIGLTSMRERVSAFEGTLTINSKPGEGTEIIVEIPCRNV